MPFTPDNKTQPRETGFVPDKEPGMLGKVGRFVGDVINLPSYAVGGAIKDVGEGVRGLAGGQFTADNLAKVSQISPVGLMGPAGAYRSIMRGFKPYTERQSVMQELPTAVGLDPNSAGGMALGFAGELATPGLPVGAALKSTSTGAKALDTLGDAGRAVNPFSKVGGVTNDVGRELLEKSYKLSASDIDKIAEAIGATDEATKAVKVIDYLESLGLSGSNSGSLKKIGNIITGEQDTFNKLTRTGKTVGRQGYIDNLLEEAINAERLDTPQSRRLSKQLFDEAMTQSEKMGMTDTDFTDKISKLFSETSASKLADPSASSLSKRMAIAGQNARETFAEGSMKSGRKLRGLREAESVLGKKSNTGRGTQLLNAFKPSAFGMMAGAGVGASTSDNPLAGGAIGAIGGTVLNRPATLNKLGKVATKGLSTPSGMGTVGKIGSKVLGTGVRVGMQQRPSTYQTSPQATQAQRKQVVQPQQKRVTFKPPTKNNESSISQPRLDPFERKKKTGFYSDVKLKTGSY